MGEFLNGDLDDRQSFVRAFYDHPLIQSLSKGKNGRPSYLPPALVARVVEGVVLSKTAVDVAGDSVEGLKQAIDALPVEVVGADGTSREPNRVKELLQALLAEAETKAGAIGENFRRTVSAHFDMTMDRASGWFKRKVQLITLLVATALVGFNNVDTVTIAKALAADPEARSALVTLADAQVEATRQLGEAADQASGGSGSMREGARASSGAATAGNASVSGEPGSALGSTTIGQTASDTERLLEQATRQTGEAVSALKDAVSTLKVSEIPLGWSAADLPDTAGALLVKLAGLVVSIFAVALGAPFWFGVLQQLNAVRSTGTVPKTSDDGSPSV